MTTSPLTHRFGIPLGVRLPYRGPGVTPESIIEVARAAEDAGFDSGWVGDHIVWPQADRSTLRPWSGSSGYPYSIDDLQLEPLTVLNFIGSHTRSIKLGTGILVATLRPPLLLAKQASSLDYLLPGRLVLGVASGWLEQEFDALGVPFHDRGRRLEETVGILRECWTSENPTWNGEYWKFGPLHFEPRPAQPIPIWFGGHAEIARRRAALLGDGWIETSSGPEALAVAVADFRRWRPSDLPPLDICGQCVVAEGGAKVASEGVERLRDAGATMVILKPDYEDESPQRLLRLIGDIAESCDGA